MGLKKRVKIFQEINKVFKKTSEALIISHVDPDGDSIGSSLALASVLKERGIKTYLFCRDDIPETYHFLKGTSHFLKKIPSKFKGVVIVLDCGHPQRMGIKLDPKKIKTLINIDHHPDNPHFGDINLVEGVSATAELIYLLLKYLKVKMSPEAATALYTALITDTGNFIYDNTTLFAFKMAEDLIKKGADPHAIAIEVYESRSLSSFRIMGEALKKMELFLKGKVALTVISKAAFKRYKAKEEDANGVVDYLRSIKGVEIAVLIRESNRDYIKVNLRSKDRVDVGAIARALGGGGHIHAAGALMRGSLRKIKEKVLKEVLESLV